MTRMDGDTTSMTQENRAATGGPRLVAASSGLVVEGIGKTYK